MNSIEETIIQNLVTDQEYSRKALPYLKEVYFIQPEYREIFKEIEAFTLKYNVPPTFDALAIELQNNKNLKQNEYKNAIDILNTIKQNINKVHADWLIDATEKFVQESALSGALGKSIDIMKGSDKHLNKGSIPQILMDALSITFDPNIGHDYLSNANDRYNYYHMVEYKVPFDLKYFNMITKGGVSLKTLNVLMGGVGVGKSMVMCHMAAGNLNQGKDVLYITLELSAYEVGKRIDANLMNLPINDVINLPDNMYKQKIDTIKGKTQGRLIIKEYPTVSASVLHFKALLNELLLKKNFKPTVIYIDYLNLCLSSRIKPGASMNMYSYVKSIAEEIRGLAVEYNVAIISATQLNRQGFVSSDPGMENTAESFGLPATADLMLALVTSDELKQLNQMVIKQLKNRYNDESVNNKFVIGVDKSKMKLYDVEENAQTLINGEEKDEKPKEKSREDKFSQLKI